MSKGHNLQDPFLNVLRKERVPVSIFLVNGIKLQGQVESFDQFVVLLKNTVSQMVYKHAISTIVPSRVVRLPSSGADEDDGGDYSDDQIQPVALFFERPESGERAVLVHIKLNSESEPEDPREFEELVLSAGGDPVEFLSLIHI